MKVARKLAVRTVIGWFGNLSFDQQRDALGQMQSEHDKSRSAKRTELEKQLAVLGYAAPKRKGRPPMKASNGTTTMPSKGRRRKVKAKFRDPKTKDTWSGRGRMASWLKAKQDAGEKIEKYLV
jgi:DNA-binding protein H-NS